VLNRDRSKRWSLERSRTGKTDGLSLLRNPSLSGPAAPSMMGFAKRAQSILPGRS
jgi:hypothetical protein